MVYSSGLKLLVVTVTMVGGGHDQWVEGKYLSSQCNREAMALAMQFKGHAKAGIAKVEIDCLREAEYERRKNERYRGGHRKESRPIHDKAERGDPWDPTDK